MISTPNLPGYRVEELVYSGSKTLVYRGICEAGSGCGSMADEAVRPANIPVIIKVLRDAFSTLSQRVQFRNQHTIASQLNSSHVVKPLALERYDNGYALVMPDQGAIVLSKYWSPGPHSLTDFLFIAIQLAEALHDLGKQRVIHKDIKPGNILIHPHTHHIQLIDFSLSSLLPKEQQQLANLTVLEGTLAYISPEQTGRMNRSVDYRTDFYSLGVTFFELLTGQLPFIESDPMALLHAHLAKVPEAPHKLRADIPQVLSKIVLKLMAKNAEDRYQSALGLKYDLEKCLEQLETQSAAPGHASDSAPDDVLEASLDVANKGSRDRAQFDCEPFELGTRDVCDRFLIPEKLYGRQSEVSKLLKAFERVSAGSAELMMVTGFSGIGKTAVVNEVHKPITRQQGYFIQGKFDQLNRNRPFSAFLQAFSGLIEQLLSESDDKLAVWRTRILKAVGNNGQILIDVIPGLVKIIGAQPPVLKLSGSAAQNRFNLLLGQFIRTLATADHPLVIFLDDLQWVDSASLGLLKLLIDASSSQHLLILGAYRNNEVSPAHPLMLALADIPVGSQVITTLTLEVLSQENITQLVADTLLCPVESVVPLARQIYQKTEGNPFFTTQFLQGLHREGLITFEADIGYWQCDLAAVQQLALTDDVVDFMIARLRKLPTATRTALMLAACIGNQFDLATLAVVTQKSQSETAADLWQGLQEGFVIPESEIYKFFQGDQREGKRVGEGLVGYRFLHDRVQQAAYALIQSEKKQETHWEIGQKLLASVPRDVTLSLALQKTPQKTSPTTSEAASNTTVLGNAEHKLPSNIDWPLFEIVDQLNAGSSLTTAVGDGEATHEESRQQLIQLNLLAGQQAKAATAYVAALAYFQAANALLLVDSWATDYALTLGLKCETIETAYLSLSLASVESVMAEVLSNAHNLLDKIKVYEIQIQAAIGENRLIEAVNRGFEVLEQLGITLLNPDEITITLPPLEALDSVPLMRDPAKVAALRILVSMFSAIYNGRPELLKPTIWTMVNLCTTEGHTAVSPVAYSVYGMSMCGSGHIEEGYQSGRIALQLTEAPLGRAMRGKVLEQLGGFISHWKEPVKNSIEQFEAGLQSGLDVGDIEYACHSAKNACAHLVLLGTPLEQVQQKQLHYIELGEQLNQQHILTFAKIWRQLSLNLIGQSSDFSRRQTASLTSTQTASHTDTQITSQATTQTASQDATQAHLPWMLVGKSFDEQAMLPTLKAKNNYFSLYVIYFSKQMLCYLFGQINQAVEITRILERYSEASLGSLMSVVQNFYTSLIWLAAYRDASKARLPQQGESEQGESEQDASEQDASEQVLLEQVFVNQTKLRQWAEHAPMNHLHKYWLVEAEKQAVLGNKAEAIDLYDRAIAAAKASEFSQEEALANELAAKFYLAWGKRRVAAGYLQEAYCGYAHWGAYAKTKALRQDYPELLQPVLSTEAQPMSVVETLAEVAPIGGASQAVSTDISSAHGSLSSHPQGLNSTLDLAAVLKASRAISQTIHLDELLHQLTTIILQSSGGDRCALMLPNDENEWQLQAIATLETSTLCSEPLEGHQQLPVKLIQYVKNSQQVVMINRLETELAVIDDYLQQQQPQSLLCLPLLNQGGLIGILYLHNLSTSGVFTEHRLSVLNFLCTEAATSLEKASLYRAQADYSRLLESKVKARTQDLEQEVRDRKQAQAAAEVANRVKSEFLANMSHELRSPLNAILGFAQVMSRSPVLPETHREDVKIISHSGEHLLGLINDVLDMSKIEAGRTILTPSDFDLHSLLDELRALFHLKATEKSLQYDVSYSADVPQYIYADPGKLRQILMNLLSNAFKFTQTGHIVLRVRGSDDDPTIATLGHATLDNTTLGSTTVNNTGQENGLNQHSPQALSPQAPNPQAPNITLVFEVEDSGPGIVASELSTLFEPFVQTQTGRSSLQGTGLGLAISRKFVQLMGGDITLSSPVFDGSGTLASFHIQAALTTDIAIAGLMSPGQSPQHRIIAGLAPGQPSYRLLIVDDQTTNRKLLVKLLGPLGFELREAPDGPAAIAQCQRWQPHLILMDMRMPVMNGTETIQRIRALTTLTVQPKIVALSASTLLKEQTAAREAGCNAFMSKPFQETTLLHCIAQQIGARYCYRETRVSGVAAQPGGAQVHQRAAQSVTQQTTAQQTTQGQSSQDQFSQGQSPVSHDLPSQSPSLLPVTPLQELALSTLSPELLTALEAATVKFQWTEIVALIEQIRLQDDAIAEGLSQALHQFQYTQILQAIQAVGPPADPARASHAPLADKEPSATGEQ